jgi:hypothetical protein
MDDASFTITTLPPIDMLKQILFSSLLSTAGIFAVSPLLGNLIVNPNFNSGVNNLDGYEAFAFWSKGAASFGSNWALADAPLTANGSGTAVFGMNTQLAAADAFWIGATQVMTIQQNFWTPDNKNNVTSTLDLYNQTLTFRGIAQVTEAYAAGNSGEVFIQFLDQNFDQIGYFAQDVALLDPVGLFELTATAPAGGLNIIQIGFRNSGIEGTAGQMTVSNLSLAAIPEPSTYAAILAAVMGLVVIGFRRRK